MPPLRDKLKGLKNPYAPQPPLWQGPCSDGPQGGVTQGLLARYLSCAERFRVKVVDGLTTPPSFNARMEFGNCWHVCEEDLASGTGHDNLHEYAKELARQYPLDRDEINLWYGKAKALFPHYVAHWAQHPDVLARTPLLQEQVFRVPYTLPSGRVVCLRGKWDSVDLVGEGNGRGIWLQENKTKSSIHVGQLTQQLPWDLQVMTYLVALETFQARPKQYRLGGEGIPRGTPTRGVRYNVVKRPAHRTVSSMLDKLGVDLRNGRSGEWFARFNVEMSPADLQRFRRQCLDPLLENLCDDWEWWEYVAGSPSHTPALAYDYGVRARFFPKHQARHLRKPYYYDPVSDGATGEVDVFLQDGNRVGLVRATTLFPELEGA